MFLSKAPLRIGLAGGGTDIAPYTHDFGGAVLSATINKYVYVKLKPIDGELSTFILSKGATLDRYEIGLEKVTSLSSYPDEFQLICETCRYILSQESRLDQAIYLEVTLDADLGGGLGSSSALAVAIVAGLFHYLNVEVTPYDVARIAFNIERVLLNHVGGKQDQYAAAFGGFNFMRFNGDEVHVKSLKISEEIQVRLTSHLLLYNTNKLRVSGEIIEDQQRNITDKKDRYLESLHFLKKQAYELREILLKGRIDELGKFLHEGWLHKKSTSNRISTEELDRIYNSALGVGATGGKVLGAGGGGYMLFYCPTDDIKEDLTRELRRFGGSIIPFNFSNEGVNVKCVAEE